MAQQKPRVVSHIEDGDSLYKGHTAADWEYRFQIQKRGYQSLVAAFRKLEKESSQLREELELRKQELKAQRQTIARLSMQGKQESSEKIKRNYWLIAVSMTAVFFFFALMSTAFGQEGYTQCHIRSSVLMMNGGGRCSANVISRGNEYCGVLSAGHCVRGRIGGKVWFYNIDGTYFQGELVAVRKEWDLCLFKGDLDGPIGQTWVPLEVPDDPIYQAMGYTAAGGPHYKNVRFQSSYSRTSDLYYVDTGNFGGGDSGGAVYANSGLVSVISGCNDGANCPARRNNRWIVGIKHTRIKQFLADNWHRMEGAGEYTQCPNCPPSYNYRYREYDDDDGGGYRYPPPYRRDPRRQPPEEQEPPPFRPDPNFPFKPPPEQEQSPPDPGGNDGPEAPPPPEEEEGSNQEDVDEIREQIEDIRQQLEEISLESGPEGPPGERGPAGPPGDRGPAGPGYVDARIKDEDLELKYQTEEGKELWVSVGRVVGRDADQQAVSSINNILNELGGQIAIIQEQVDQLELRLTNVEEAPAPVPEEAPSISRVIYFTADGYNGNGELDDLARRVRFEGPEDVQLRIVHIQPTHGVVRNVPRLFLWEQGSEVRGSEAVSDYLNSLLISEKG